MRWSGLLVIASLLAARPARGDDAPPSDPDDAAPSAESRRVNDLVGQPVAEGLPAHPSCQNRRYRTLFPQSCATGLRRTAAIATALTAGFVIHGTGSYLVGEKRAAKRLAIIEAIGLGGMLAGGGPVGISGGLPATMPLVPVLLVGAGMFFTSWWADVGVAAGASRTGTARAAAPWSLELSTLYLSDPYRQAGLGRLRGEVALGRVTLGASAMSDAENEIRTGELNATTRLLGAAPTGEVTREILDDGSRLLVRAGLRGHQDDGDHIKLATAELEVIGRLDLFHIERALSGSFVQMSTGIGVDRAYYTGAQDNNSVLLGTFGWGLYLGNRGEFQLFYDHRRESMVGGLAAGRAAGFVGSVNGSLDWLFDRRWGTHLEVNVGNAWLTTLGLRYRGGVK